MITQNQFLDHIEQFYSKNLTIAKQKNQDYAGDSDVFKSFKVTEALGNTTVEEGFVVRMSDKLARISTLISVEDVQVKDEAITDTLADLANYAAIMSAYLDSKVVNTVHLTRADGTKVKIK